MDSPSLLEKLHDTHGRRNVSILAFISLNRTDGSRMKPLIILGKQNASAEELQAAKDNGAELVFGPKGWFVTVLVY